MAWTIDHTQTALNQLHKLDKQSARRILGLMEERVVQRDDPHSTGKALTGPLGGLVGTGHFLSCLHGSEVQAEASDLAATFLSCLHGSEA